MQERIFKLLERFAQVEGILAEPEAIGDQKQFRALVQEHAYLSSIKELWNRIEAAEHQRKENLLLAKEESDPEFVQVIREEIARLEAELTRLRAQLELLLVPPDPRDDRNIILELRAGTGGDEAALFVGDCVRMYRNYADKQKWRFEPLSCTPSEKGGFRDYVITLAGHNVFRYMQYEAGTHRVQRVPETEAQGRVHTSAVTVAVLLEPDEEEQEVIDEKELKIDTYRSSGAGGQHVNTTDSAVRITHLPTNTVVYCQEERSQHKNKEKAMRLLVAKLADAKQQKLASERASERQSQVGSGDRSERIRTYNFPQNRLTDHRIDLTLYKLDRIMQGDLDELTHALVNYFYEQRLRDETAI